MDIVTYALLNGKIKNYASNVDEWLEENVDPDTGYVLDRSLQMENAAAPADMVGDINDEVDDLKNTLTQLETNVGKILPVITGTTNNSGYTIVAGDYFIANGTLYQNKTSAAIPIGGVWSGTAVSGTAINSLTETGTWIPVVNSGDFTALTVSNGKYTRIGRFMYASFLWQTTASATGVKYTTVSGLPYSFGSDNNTGFGNNYDFSGGVIVGPARSSYYVMNIYFNNPATNHYGAGWVLGIIV